VWVTGRWEAVVLQVLTGTGGAGTSRINFGNLGPVQAYIAIRNRHWQSPGLSYTKLPA
jgi:hypothetical protein